MEHDVKRCPSARHGPSVVSSGSGPRLWSVVALSILGSAAVVAAVGCFCALLYPILKGKRVRVGVGVRDFVGTPFFFLTLK